MRLALTDPSSEFLRKFKEAYIRCPMLRVDPRQRQRLAEIIDNLQRRLDEATERRWLGEVQGLQISLNAAKDKLAAVDRLTQIPNLGPALLGPPAVERKELPRAAANAAISGARRIGMAEIVMTE